ASESGWHQNGVPSAKRASSMPLTGVAPGICGKPRVASRLPGRRRWRSRIGGGAGLPRCALESVHYGAATVAPAVFRHILGNAHDETAGVAQLVQKADRGGLDLGIGTQMEG